jgi:hypothetical protein
MTFPSQARRIKHVKRQSTYSVVCSIIADKEYNEGDLIGIKGLRNVKTYAEVQCSLGPIKLYDSVIIYRCETDGKYWARKNEDINSPGRFEVLA